MSSAEQPAFGEEIRTLRIGKGFSQGALARELGVNALAVGRWENQGVVPRYADLILEKVRGLSKRSETPTANLGHGPAAKGQKRKRGK